MNTFFEQLKNEATRIRMSDAERSLMRSELEAAMRYAPVRARGQGRRSRGLFPKVLAIGISSALVLGGSVAYAAEGALPGDSLYTVKLGVNERVLGATAVSVEAKIAWHEKKAERRIQELATLTYDARLTPDIAQELEARIEESAQEGEALVVEDTEKARAARSLARFAAVRSVARTLASASMERGNAAAPAFDTSATLSIAAAPVEPGALALRAGFAKSAPEGDMQAFSMAAPASVQENSVEDEVFVSELEREAEDIVLRVEKRIERIQSSTTTRDEARMRVERLKERIEGVRERREHVMPERELRDVLERGAELDVVLKTEERIQVDIVPRLPL